MCTQAVDRFVIGRKDVGEVAFIGPVDVRGLVLDDIIDVEKGRIQIYGLPGGAQRPAVGQGLNQPALLTFRYASLSPIEGRTSLPFLALRPYDVSQHHCSIPRLLP